MQKDRQIPAWLARRTYFKRIERWAKPGKARKTMPAPETGPIPALSNVVPFPARSSRPDRPAFDGLRGVVTA